MHKAGPKATTSLGVRSDMLSAQRAYKALVRAGKRKLISTQIGKAGQRGCQQRTQAISNWYKHAEGGGQCWLQGVPWPASHPKAPPLERNLYQLGTGS